ncbi:MAG: hypothetical protein QOJ39_1862 [Candidatus Eremiobacteraeota bacterium]|jgi:hypothetical protein|nr:hypothetical protein [Candidatus Eremiobacteraeota bacterium]
MRLLLLIAVIAAIAALCTQRAEAAMTLTANGLLPYPVGSTTGPLVPIEHTETRFKFTLTANGAAGAGSPVTGYVCAVDENRYNPCAPVAFSAPGNYHGFAPWLAPDAAASAPVQLKFCPSKPGALIDDVSCVATVAAFTSTPVSAQFGVSIAGIGIEHTRAVHNDTIAVTILGGGFASKPVCTQVPSAACVQGALEGNHNNGSLLVQNAKIGPFTVTPGQNGAFRFGFAVYNIGDGYSTSVYNELTSNVSGILSDALTEQIVLGDSAIAGPYTEQINHLKWKGCDGPLAVGLVGFFDTTEVLAKTNATGAYDVVTPSYHFKSQTGCGLSPDYNLVYDVIRMSWRPAGYGT